MGLVFRIPFSKQIEGAPGLAFETGDASTKFSDSQLPKVARKPDH
jgi:hypothetical protein